MIRERVPELPQTGPPVPGISKRGDDGVPDDIEDAFDNARSMQEMEAAYQLLADWMKRTGA